MHINIWYIIIYYEVAIQIILFARDHFNYSVYRYAYTDSSSIDSKYKWQCKPPDKSKSVLNILLESA